MEGDLGFRAELKEFLMVERMYWITSSSKIVKESRGCRIPKECQGEILKRINVSSFRSFYEFSNRRNLRRPLCD